MNPAYSVIFLTTLIGAGQGLFLALFGAELAGFGHAEAAIHIHQRGCVGRSLFADMVIRNRHAV